MALDSRREMTLPIYSQAFQSIACPTVKPSGIGFHWVFSVISLFVYHWEIRTIGMVAFNLETIQKMERSKGHKWKDFFSKILILKRIFQYPDWGFICMCNHNLITGVWGLILLSSDLQDENYKAVKALENKLNVLR